MKKRYILRFAAITAAITLTAASLSGCGKYNSSNVPGSNAGSADAGASVFEGNTDITAGIENADTTYSCEAELGEDKVSATVDALASSVKTKDFSNVAALKDKSDKALNEARIPYLMDSYSEDEETAQQDIKDLYSDPAPSDSQLAEITTMILQKCLPSSGLRIMIFQILTLIIPKIPRAFSLSLIPIPTITVFSA